MLEDTMNRMHSEESMPSIYHATQPGAIYRATQLPLIDQPGALYRESILQPSLHQAMYRRDAAKKGL